MHPVLCRWLWGGFGSYSVILAASYALAVGWLWTQRKHVGVPARLFWPVSLAIVAASVLGAKLGYVIVEWDEFRADPGLMLETWQSGWVMWGGWILGASVGTLICRAIRPKIDVIRYLDYCFASIAVAQPLGRLGCLLDGCCHGRPTGAWWGIAFRDVGSSVDPAYLGVPLHPTQILELLGTGLAAVVIVGVLLPRLRSGRLRAGSVFLGYPLYYAVLRFFLEFLRGDDRGALLSPVLSPSQWVCLAVGAACACGLAFRRKADAL